MWIGVWVSPLRKMGLSLDGVSWGHGTRTQRKKRRGVVLSVMAEHPSKEGGIWLLGFMLRMAIDRRDCTCPGEGRRCKPSSRLLNSEPEPERGNRIKKSSYPHARARLRFSPVCPWIHSTWTVISARVKSAKTTRLASPLLTLIKGGA